MISLFTQLVAHFQNGGFFIGHLNFFRDFRTKFLKSAMRSHPSKSLFKEFLGWHFIIYKQNFGYSLLIWHFASWKRTKNTKIPILGTDIGSQQSAPKNIFLFFGLKRPQNQKNKTFSLGNGCWFEKITFKNRICTFRTKIKKTSKTSEPHKSWNIWLWTKIFYRVLRYTKGITTYHLEQILKGSLAQCADFSNNGS